MMKLILSLTLIWTLSTTAEALSCLVGEGREYSSRPCPPGDADRCAFITKQEKVGGIFKTSTKRLCVPSSLFSERFQTFSHNIGYGPTAVSVAVCKTYNCNTRGVMDHTMPVNNSLQCYTCDDPSSAVCNKTVQCVNKEDRCLSGTENSKTLNVLGCASANLCEVPARLEFLMSVNFFRPPKCCRGSFCNSEQNTEALSCLVGEGREYSSRPCPPGDADRCATIRTQEKVRGIFKTSTKRLCVQSSLFSEGFQTFSYNVGYGPTAVSVVVCKIDNCNTDSIMDHAMPVSNSLQCYTCDDPSSAVCNKTVQCVNMEDRCLSGTASSPENSKTLNVLGCASANLCEVPARLEFLMSVNFFRPPKCCRGSFCNSAQNSVSCKEETLFVYRRIGGEAILPCTNLESPVCSSVSWKLYKGGHVTYTTEVNKGQVNKDSDKSSRMSLTSNCSLILRDLKVKDAGNYICMLHQQTTTHVYLSVLAITTTSSISDLRPGGNLSLNCILFSYYDAGSCKAYSKLFTLSWAAEDGSQLTDDSRATDQNRCNVTLVTELQREDNMRRWRCQVKTAEGSPAAFLDFISIFLLEQQQLPPTPQNQTSVAPVECPIQLPISRIMLCVALPLMVIVVGVFTRRPNHQRGKRSGSGIELRVLS